MINSLFKTLNLHNIYLVERSLEVKLLTLWTDGEAEVVRKKIQVREKVEKSRFTAFFN